MCREKIKLAGQGARSLTVLLVALGACAASLAGHAGDASASALDLATPTPLSALFAAEPGVPNLTGVWEIVNDEGGTQTDTLTLTGPDTYTYSNGLGWWTTDVVISGSSATIWICGAGGTYSEADEDACPERSGYWLEPWNFDLTPKPGDPYTAYGSYAAYNNGETSHTGTFTATGPTPARASPELSIAPATVAAPASGTSTANFTVSLSEASANTVSVDYSTQDGTGSNAATAPGDYEATSGTLTFSPGETTKTIPVTVNAGHFSGERTFTVALSNAQEANIATGQATGTITASHVRIVGSVLDTREKAAYGVTVTLSGTDDEGTGVSETTKTNSAGKYGFEVAPGNYEATASGDPPQQNGGKLAVAAKPGLSPAETADLKGTGSVGLGTVAEPEPPGCTGTGKEATCKLTSLQGGERGIASFTYTSCGATERMPKGKAPTGCPIVFVPGFLGSRIACGSKELWTNAPRPDFGELQLLSNGATNGGAPGSCNSQAAPIDGQAGVVDSFAGVDVYGKALEFLNRIAPQRVWAYPYDWRKSPLLATEGLGKLVDQILSQTGAARVVIMAHSMGGLVTQAYVANPENAEKVSRVVTLGTPYWGAPKSHVALLTGHTGGIPFELVGIDLFGAGSELQTAARNMLGLYWLYPSTNYGPWLKIVGKSWSNRQLGGSEIDPWVISLGGQRSLVDAAMSGHSMLDGFKTNGIDYQIVVGTGEPTITSLEVEDNDFEATQIVKAGFGSGDGTVPALSATQGAFPTGKPRGDDVPIHYVCHIDHVALPSNYGVQSNIEGFLLEGKPIGGADDNCPYTGAETQIYHVVVPNHGNGAHITSANSAATVTTAEGKLTLEQAAKAGLIQLIELGGKTTVITDSDHPVTLNLSGSGLAVRVRSLANNAKPRYYGPLEGTVTISETGLVKRGGKALKAHRSDRAPHTVAHVSRRGNRFVVRLAAKASARLAGTYYRIGGAAAKRYTKPLKLTRTQLKRLRFGSVDVFGHWEKPKKSARSTLTLR